MNDLERESDISWTNFTLIERLYIFGGSLASAWLIIELLQFLGVADVLGLISKVFIVVIVGLLAVIATLVTEFYETTPPIDRVRTEPKPTDTEGSGDIDDTRNVEDEVEVRITDAGTSRRDRNLPELIKTTNHRLDFLGLSWAPLVSEGPMDQLFNTVRDDDISVRVLVLNPFLPSAMNRNTEMYTSRGLDPLPVNIARSIRSFRRLEERLAREGNRFGGEFDARIYTDIPTMSCYFKDDVLNFTPYVVHRTGMQSPFIEIQRSGDTSLYSVYSEHFDRLFEDATPVSANGLIEHLRDQAGDFTAVPEDDVIDDIEQILGEGEQ